MYLFTSNVINNSKKCSKNSEYVQLEGAFIMCLLPRAYWKKFSWHSYSKIPSSSQPWMNVMDNFSESHVLAACDCFSILLAAAAQSGPPAARRLPPTQTRLTLFMGRRIFYHRLRDRCGGRLGGSKLNLLWVVGPGYCFGLTPAHISGPRLLPDYLQVAIVLHRLRA